MKRYLIYNLLFLTTGILLLIVLHFIDHRLVNVFMLPFCFAYIMFMNGIYVFSALWIGKSDLKAHITQEGKRQIWVLFNVLSLIANLLCFIVMLIW